MMNKPGYRKGIRYAKIYTIGGVIAGAILGISIGELSALALFGVVGGLVGAFSGFLTGLRKGIE